MADRGGSNVVIGVVLGAILVLLVIFLFFGGTGIFVAEEPGDVDVEIQAPEAPDGPAAPDAPAE